MALKALMFRRNIDLKEAELAALAEKDAEFATREAELEAAINEVKDDEERSAVEQMVTEFDEQRGAHDAAKAALSAELDELRAKLAETEANTPPAPAQHRSAELNNERKVPTMHNNVNIRSLPKNQRAFEAAFSYEERRAIAQQEDVRTFFDELRAMHKRGVGGAELMIPTVFLPLIMENMFRYSKLLNRVDVQELSGTGKQTIAGLVPPAVWVDSCGDLNELTFNFAQIILEDYKVGGFVPVCNSLLEDATEDGNVNLASAVVEMLSMAIGLAEDAAILYGTGNGMPLGIVTRLAQTSQPANYPANAPTWTDLHSSHIIVINGDSLTGAQFWAALQVAEGNTFTRYNRGNKFWAMNSKTYAYLKSKAIATNITGEWVAMLGGVLPIIGGDIDVLEFIPDYDIVGGYGELYKYGVRQGLTIGADGVGAINRIKDQTIFFGKKRADGQPAVAGAFVAMNIKNTSVTTTYAFPTDKANDATLASLVIGETLSPTFDKTTLTYTATASNASDVVTVIPSQNTAEVSLTLKKGTSTAETILNGSTVTWGTGTNVLTVTVKQGASTLTYTVTVTKN